MQTVGQVEIPLHSQTLLALRLLKDPFIGPCSTDFALPAWTSQFQLIQHLTLYSNVMMVLTGNKGAGKSVFARQLQGYLPCDISSNHLEALPDLGARQVESQLIQMFSLSSSCTSISGLIRQLKERRHHSLVVIDNAEKLSQTVVKTMVEWIKIQRDEAYLHFLLVGESVLKSQLEKYYIPDLPLFLHCFELSPMNLKEAERYLLHRLQAVGYHQKELPLNTSQMANLYKRANGNFLLLHQFAAELLNSKYVQVQQNLPKKKGRQPSIPFVVGGIVVLMFTLFIAMQLFRNGDEKHLKTLHLPESVTAKAESKPLPLPDPLSRGVFRQEDKLAQEGKSKLVDVIKNKKAANSAIDIENRNSLLQKKVAEKQKQVINIAKEQNIKVHRKPAIQLADKTDENLAYEPTKAQQQQAVEAASTEVFKPPVILDSVVVLPDPRQATKKTSAISKTTFAKEKEAKKVAVKNRPVVIQSRKLVSATGHLAYGIQILGTGSIDAMKAFINQHQLENKTYYYRVKRGRRPWYVLIYGQYVSKYKAREAIKLLPWKFRRMSPWARSVKSLGSPERSNLHSSRKRDHQG